MNNSSLNRLKNKKGKIWLNVASSTFVIDDYINLDNHIFFKYLTYFKTFSFFLNKNYQKYINDFVEGNKKTKMLVHDCRKKLKFPNESVDHVLCSHFLEHVFPEEMTNIVKDFYRCLKPGGTMHIIVPDLNSYVQDYINNSKNEKYKATAADTLIEDTILSRRSRGNSRFRILEFLGGFGLNHRWMYDKASMEKKIIDLGFKIVKKEEVPSSAYDNNVGSKTDIKGQHTHTSVHVYAKKV
jgi:SAM-dependent methyltransferase